MRTTLNQIRAHHPCHDGWWRLLRGLNKTKPDDEPLWIDQILDHNGLEDALWCLRAVENCDREIRLFAVWCARRVQHLMTDARSVAALDVAERYARGEASDQELEAARGLAYSSWHAKIRLGETASAASAASAAYAAALASAPGAAAWAAAYGAAAEWAAAGADRDAERAAQADELRRICRELREAKP
ncbi:MAG: hypothetical protein ACK52I_07180 [Pseudomonadota bacterium]